MDNISDIQYCTDTEIHIEIEIGNERKWGNTKDMWLEWWSQRLMFNDWIIFLNLDQSYFVCLQGKWWVFFINSNFSITKAASQLLSFLITTILSAASLLGDNWVLVLNFQQSKHHCTAQLSILLLREKKIEDCDIMYVLGYSSESPVIKKFKPLSTFIYQIIVL